MPVSDFDFGVDVQSHNLPSRAYTTRRAHASKQYVPQVQVCAKNNARGYRNLTFPLTAPVVDYEYRD